MHNEMYVAPLELKFVSDGGATGEVEGYGSVFGVTDSHGDVIAPGAFANVLAGHKAAGTMPTMFVQHGPALGGDALPAGVWTDMVEDDKGLKVKGKISALDTDYGRRIRSLVQDGALKGLSIGYRVGPGNAVMGKRTGEPKRLIKGFDLLAEVSLVDSPSNARAQVDSIKSLIGIVDKDAATQAVAHAIALHAASMSGGDSPTVEERAKMLAHLQDAHEAMTGKRMPAGVKSAPATIREFETALREMGFSRAEAQDIAKLRFKTTATSGEESDQATDDALAEIKSLLGDIKLS